MEAFPLLRQSHLSTFDNCSLSSKFETDLRRGWDYSYQARGSAFHLFAGRAMQEMRAQGEGRLEVDVALAILNEVLRQDEADKHCPHCGSTRIKKGVTKSGMRTCLGCRRRFETEVMNLPMAQVKDLVWVVKKWAYDNWWDVENLVSIEERLGGAVSYPNPYGGHVTRTLTGKTDTILLDQHDPRHAIVIDWKDMWAVPPPQGISFGGYFQQRFYAWLVMTNYKGIERVTLREFYVRFSEPREATIWRSGMDDLELEFAALVERFDRAYEEKLWRPSPGRHCGYCTAPHRCPILPEARAEGRITDETEAQRVAAQLVVAQENVKRSRVALMAWADTHGPVPVRDAKGRRAFGYRESERTYSPKPEDIVRAQAEKGRPLNDEEIRSLYRTEKGTRFEAFTPQAIEAEEEDQALMEALQKTLAEAQARVAA